MHLNSNYTAIFAVPDKFFNTIVRSHRPPFNRLQRRQGNSCLCQPSALLPI